MTDLPKIADSIDPRTQHFECGKKSLHVQVPLASLITASDALRAAQERIEKLHQTIAALQRDGNGMMCKYEAAEAKLDKIHAIASDSDKRGWSDFDRISALTSKDQHHG